LAETGYARQQVHRSVVKAINLAKTVQSFGRVLSAALDRRKKPLMIAARLLQKCDIS
jgi:hypothetical protein